MNEIYILLVIVLFVQSLLIFKLEQKMVDIEKLIFSLGIAYAQTGPNEIRIRYAPTDSKKVVKGKIENNEKNS